MPSRGILQKRLTFESLEPRLVLSLTFDLAAIGGGDHHTPTHGGGPGGGGGGGGNQPSGPAIDLATVALHEFGHSLGLPHSTHPACGTANQPIMCPYYIGDNFQLHAEDVAKIQALYPESGVQVPGTWLSTDITYSFTPDGARMDQGGKNTLFKTMNAAFGTPDVWEQIFADALQLWSDATGADGTNVQLSFSEVADDGSAFNASGQSQGDIRFGDLRIASHGFDGASGVIAHAYYPPPNGSTAAGDAHFDKAENWQDLRDALLAIEGGAASTETGANTLVLNELEPTSEQAALVVLPDDQPDAQEQAEPTVDPATVETVDLAVVDLADDTLLLHPTETLLAINGDADDTANDGMPLEDLALAGLQPLSPW